MVCLHNWCLSSLLVTLLHGVPVQGTPAAVGWCRHSLSSAPVHGAGGSLGCVPLCVCVCVYVCALVIAVPVQGVNPVVQDHIGHWLAGQPCEVTFDASDCFDPQNPFDFEAGAEQLRPALQRALTQLGERLPAGSTVQLVSERTWDVIVITDVVAAITAVAPLFPDITIYPPQVRPQLCSTVNRVRPPCAYRY